MGEEGKELSLPCRSRSRNFQLAFSKKSDLYVEMEGEGRRGPMAKSVYLTGVKEMMAMIKK